MHAPLTRLAPPYHWLVDEAGAYLHFGAGCCASVSRRGGAWTTVIRFQRHTHEARCGSIVQGMHWIERWFEKQKGKGPPGLLAKGPRWYERRVRHAWERELEREILAPARPCAAPSIVRPPRFDVDQVLPRKPMAETLTTF